MRQFDDSAGAKLRMRALTANLAATKQRWNGLALNDQIGADYARRPPASTNGIACQTRIGGIENLVVGA